MPKSNFNGISLRTEEGNPLFCGGGNLGGYCYEYLPETNSWVIGPNMIGERDESAYVELPDGRFWVLGGYDTSDRYTTEYYNQGVFTMGPDLPTEVGSHTGYSCATQIDEDLTFFAAEKA